VLASELDMLDSEHGEQGGSHLVYRSPNTTPLWIVFNSS